MEKEKKRKIQIYIIILIIVLVIFVTGIFIYKNANKQKRYNQIIDSFENSVKWEIKVIEKYGHKEDSCNVDSEEIIKSDYLISQGYLKKEDMLDIDNESYCSAYTKLKGSKECKYVYGKIYIKCKDFVTNGHAGW